MDTLLGTKYFSKSDLGSSYWQVEMKEEHKEDTDFTVGNLGFYKCNRMAYGLTMLLLHFSAYLVFNGVSNILMIF